MSVILEIQNVTKSFDGLIVVRDCNIELETGVISGLIGPNGAGKSTLFNIVAGVYPPDRGSVRLNNVDVTGLPAYQVCRLGLLRTFQIPREFSNMSTIENLLMVPPLQKGERLLNALFRLGTFRADENKNRVKALEILDFLGMSHVRNELAGNLSGGQKKLLELGRTLMVDAKIVLLDELGAGVNHTLLNRLADNIIRLNEEMGKTFFIIEHNMQFISKLCQKVTVLVEGQVAVEGTAEEVLNNPEVVDAYFGRRSNSD